MSSGFWQGEALLLRREPQKDKELLSKIAQPNAITESKLPGVRRLRSKGLLATAFAAAKVAREESIRRYRGDAVAAPEQQAESRKPDDGRFARRRDGSMEVTDRTGRRSLTLTERGPGATSHRCQLKFSQNR
jgi:hypothetical protein